MSALGQTPLPYTLSADATSFMEDLTGRAFVHAKRAGAPLDGTAKYAPACLHILSLLRAGAVQKKIQSLTTHFGITCVLFQSYRELLQRMTPVLSLRYYY